MTPPDGLRVVLGLGGRIMLELPRGEVQLLPGDAFDTLARALLSQAARQAGAQYVPPLTLTKQRRPTDRSGRSAIVDTLYMGPSVPGLD